MVGPQPQMTTNASDVALDSTQSNLSYVCSLLGIFEWQQHYLTPNTFIMFVFAASTEALICPFTILLNALVILAVKRKRYLRKKKPHVLLACLAGTDLFVGAVVTPLVITGHVLHILGGGPICLIDSIAMETVYIACNASFLHLVIVSVERYIAIKHALRYTTIITTSRLTTAVAVAWAVPVILGLVSGALGLAREVVLRDQLGGTAVILFLSSYLTVVLFCQVAVLLETRRHRKHMKAHQISESSAKELLQKDKAAISTTIIVGVLFLCYAPQIIFYGIALSLKNFQRSLFLGLSHVIDVFVYSNSLINPIIYCVRTQEFRRALSELLHLKLSSRINGEVRTREASRSGGKRQAWPHPTVPGGSRSRSLDLSRGSSHQPRTHRANSL